MDTNARSGSLRWVALVAVMLAAASGPLAAQPRYPSRPIEFIVPFGPGGGADQFARKLGHMMEADLKVSFPILNIPGASGNTGMAKLLTSPAEGQAMIIMAGNAFAQFAMTPPAWKLDDVQVMGMVTNEPSGLFVAQGARWKAWSDLEKEVRAKPASIKLAGTGLGSADELTTSFLASRGVRLVFVPFAKAGERFVSILGGHADVMYEQPGDVKSYLENKQMRPVLFFAEKRLGNFPDVPVSKELGYEVTLPQYRVMAIRKGTDPARVKILSTAIAKAATSADYKAFLKDHWAEESSYLPAKESDAFIRDEIEVIRKILAGMKK
jgi:tripartite-type tricarboxylate transporter receptor subunit TctC